MSSTRAKLFLMVLMAAGTARAPTGTIAGIVTDPSGAPVSGTRVSIVNREIGLTRSLITSQQGDYSAASLPPGVYRITAEAAGFPLLETAATVEAGTTTTVNLGLKLGEPNEKITVHAATPQIHYDHHQVGGVVSRDQIENLPLNGRGRAL
jgi:hypothetical protein